ncbi:uncharacterized protein BP5553_08015 [Venustampulla echinocandica]|uniref:PH domain-containing protein n=1 Tax=Venustampulla echinocandica TaxID=2656787 RepID=A0A370TFH3_9HELO|nr:uncharacterized protein BP5553_08015 [Venustampulla echinocandica]RDL33647.1 hypothetical protein BP5553_08015 [Venustampulla echinocandica]
MAYYAIKQDKLGEGRASATATPDPQNQASRDTDAPHRFHPSQSAFRLSRRVRPPPMHFAPEVEHGSRVPAEPKKLDRRASKGGLRGIFTRSKAQAENNIVSPVMEEPPHASAVPETPRSNVLRSLSIKRAPTPASQATPTTPARPTRPPSRMSLRSKSVKQPRIPNKPSPKSTKSSSSSRAPSRTSPAWDPPPLFQAYPQSIKHATLIASTLSADAILRMNNQRRNNSLRNEIAQIRPGTGGRGQNAAAKRTEKATTKHRRQLSGSISKADWTHKIFVLVTSGYLLQYAGEGSFDRLPEKMIQLGKESVAFASDAIPGKHWVVQVSQAMDADGAPAADSRSLLSRLTFRGADYRRTATSFLLILSSAEQMDSWLAVLRREVEALGGKKQISETGRPKADDKVMQLRAQPSHRYLIQRDPDQFSNPSSPRSPSGYPPWSESQLQEGLDDGASALAIPQMASTRPSTENNSATNSVASHDGQQLEGLRDSANRLSFMSSGQRTLITSQGSSITNSPTRESCSTLDDFPQKISLEDSRLRPNASAINERRRSMQTTPIPTLEAHTPRNFRHSTYGGPTRPARSPIAPNFSTPNPSNKKYPTRGPPLSKGPGGDARSIPHIVTSTPPSKIRQSMIQSKGKGLPALPLNRQSLPRVRDSAALLTPVEPSVEYVHGIEPPWDDNNARSSRPNTASLETGMPERRSSLMLIDPSDTAMSNFRFPQPDPDVPFSDTVPEKITETSITPALPPTPPAVSPLLASLPISSNRRKEHVAKPELGKVPLSSPVRAKSAIPKLRRPVSMQIRSSSNSAMNSTRPIARPSRSALLLSPPSHDAAAETISASSSTPKQDIKSPAFASAPIPALQQLHSEDDPKSLASRKSMPLLATGPPPAPPPDCALPPLPPPGAGLKPVSKIPVQA